MPHVVELSDSPGAARLVDVSSVPLPADQVRVQVRAAGLNFWQLMQVRGQIATEPRQRLGSEGMGVVTEVGEAVSSLAPGDRVAWTRVPGSLADEVVGPAGAFHLVPDAVDDHSAAGLLFQGMTAHYLAQDSWPLRRGSSAVVTAAAGGVGLLLTQLLVARGVQVIGVVSSPQKKDVVRAAGAEHVLFYGDDLTEQIKLIVPDGVAAVYDSVGGDTVRGLVDALAVQGAMVLYGAASGHEPEIPLNVLASGSRYLTRTQGKHFTADPEVARRRARELFTMVGEGKLKVHIGHSWPLEQVNTALAQLAGRQTVGKVLLIP
ncbi:2-haloacrylate reductase (plasmid) [Rhodococcus ruber]|uniref:zinc-binding dehydrogenase n=1 Tax=Rhodococcus ruber TaxID=1830 RepID=UPI00315C8DFD